jgi:hypothetical protein
MTLATMYGLVSQRLNEVAAPVFYPTAEIIAAINEANRLFCLLTLALETTASWTPTTNTTFFHMLPLFTDWIVPLRITLAGGAKVRPARLGELWALDSQWPQSPGAPYRYAAIGADLIALYRQPAVDTAVSLTYARAPLALSDDGDVPETPAEYHPVYVPYAIYRVRQMEGGEALASVLPLLGEFLDAATEYAGFVRARNIGQGYDSVPAELALFDRSRLSGKKKS